MTSASARLAALAALLVWMQTGLTRSARAASGPAATVARLEVRAAPDCASRQDLAARVLARSPGVRFVDDGAALTIRADFAALRDGEVVVELVIVGRGAGQSSRRLVARSCDEAADAIALIIAVTLNPTSNPSVAGPDAGASREEEEVGVPSGGPSASASAAPTAPPTPAAPSAAEATEQAPAVAKGQETATARRVEPTSPTPSTVVRPRIGADVAVQSFLGASPEVMPGVAVYAYAALDRAALWSPAIVLGATHAWRTGLPEPGGTASFALDAGTLDACAVRARLSVIEARACASTLVGLLSISGSETRAPAATARPFVVAGAAAILTADLGSILSLSARLTAGATIVRDSFEFTPVVFYRAPPVSLSAGLGIGVHVP
jgi:hypothetical protein